MISSLQKFRGSFDERVVVSRVWHHDHPSFFSRQTRGGLERTFLGIVGIIKATVETDVIAARKGFLQDTDPRLKVLSIALLLAATLMSRSIVELAVGYTVCVALAVSSRIRPLIFLKRTLFFIPLFSIFIVLPALFSGITPGRSVTQFTLFAHVFCITRQGIDTALIFFLRVLTCASFAILLMLTTRHHVLLKVLRFFRVPLLFVMTMGMSYRYIYLLLDVIQNTFTAIKSRVGFVKSAKTGRRIAAVNMAGLWLRSYRLQSQVYDAMISRGYTGEPQVLVEFKVKATDFIFLATAFSALIGTLWLNRFFR